MDYQELLKKARKELPKGVVISGERFEVPTAKGHVEGNKTIISNFLQICSTLGRDPSQLIKYLQRELATPAQIDGQRLIFGRKLNSDFINKKIKQFANDFVLCKECGKPDTKLIKEDRYLFLKCTACGARHSVTAKT
ncbi:translation initiation factor IF-2 subunit beta [Candidatus Woesearchaeota archaeon]|nr:translation initiation factor IF-2 subunit beta [Candidatus Woesearchaeota archaeon]